MIRNIAFLPLLSVAFLFSARSTADVIVEIEPEPQCPDGYFNGDNAGLAAWY
jgi:hypothetical protein